jgi:FPG/IleRS zinc finger protein
MQERLDVYQRTGEPCPRCGNPIKRIVIGARSTHFCSWCQRLSAADRKQSKAALRTMTGGGLPAAARTRTERTKRAAATRRAMARASTGVAG